MFHGTRSGLTFAILGLASVPAFANRVWVVNPNGTGDFTQIQPAIDAALDHDTILVKSGTYSGFTVDAKALVIVEDTAASAQVNGEVIIQNLAVGELLLLSGINVSATMTPALGLLNDAGSVRIQAATLVGYPEAARTDSCPDVFFTGCSMTGRDGIPSAGTSQPGGHGLLLIGSRAALYDCTLRGGRGGNGLQGPCFGDGGSGGSGCTISNGFLFASDTFFLGGRGGSGADGPCFGCGGPGWGGDGGDGITIASSTGSLLSCVSQGAYGGTGGCSLGCQCVGVGGAPGQAIDNANLVRILPGTPRLVEAPLVVREASTVSLGLFGQPGDFVSLYLARKTAFEFSLPRKGVFLTLPSSSARPVGPTNSSGAVTTSLSIPDLGVGVQSRVYFFQAVHRTGTDDRTLGTGRCLVVVDQAF